MLWPDAAPDAGATNLRSAIYHLRRSLGGGDPSPVLYDGSWISLNGSFTWEIDLCRFEALAEAPGADPRDLESAVALYGGEPLVDERYAEWAIPIRTHLQRLWRDGSLRLARHYRQAGEQDLAVAQYEKMLEADSCDEMALRELLLVLADMGRRTEAVRRYDQFVQRLAQELDLTPDADTQTAIEYVRTTTGEVAPAAVPAEHSDENLPTGGFLGAKPLWPIVGRGAEIEHIGVTADAVAGGAGRFLVLMGEAGIGRTRAAQEAMFVLRQRGFVVAAGRCYRRLQPVALAPVRDMVAELARASPTVWEQVAGQWPNLLPLLPDRATGVSRPIADTPQERYDLVHALTALLGAIADKRPVALLLDDLHWADDASLDVLQHVVRRTRTVRLLVLATYRDAEVDRSHPVGVVMRDLVREGLVERDALQRLTLEDTGRIIEYVLGSIEWAEEFTDFTHRRTKGNPFFIHRMLQSLGGRYRLIRQIGMGGMGRVFEAIDLRTGEHVAAKLMFARAEADPKALQRFQQEGSVLSTLDHPNIVRVHGTFLDEHASCIVMELLDGHSLRQTLRERRLEPAEIKALSSQVAAALVCAHDQGIVHRDIKPDNIMLIDNGRVKVTDFGIARLLRSSETATTMTSLGMTMGTPHYMAPEQILGQRVDGRADIYSLGAVLYEMVAGRPPFLGDEPMAVAVQHVQAPPTPPSELAPELPASWDTLIVKALAKKADERFQSAQQLREAIDALGVPAALPAGPEARERSRWSRRRVPVRAAIGVATVGLLAATAFLASAAWQGAGHTTGVGTNDLRRPLVIFGTAGTGAVQFSQLSGLDVDRSGNIFATDVGKGVLDKLSPTGKLVGQWVLGRRGATVEGGDTYEIVGPSGTVVDASGNVYVADYSYHRIQKLGIGAGSLVGWGAPGASPGPPFGATGLATDTAGNIYSVDAFNNRIYKLSPTGKLLRQWGSRGSARGQLESPGGIAVDSHRNVYVVDTGNDRIQKFSDTGVPLAQWGGTGSHPGEFVSPEGITIDDRGNLYIADTGNRRIQRLSPSGKPLDRWTTRRCNAHQIPQPVDVKRDPQGNLYVADGTSQCIQELSPRGQVLNQWGRQTASAGQLNSPHSAVVDARGNVYVADTGNDRIQQFSSEGRPLATWGTRGALVGEFVAPNGLGTDASHTIYITDTGNNRIQTLDVARKSIRLWSMERARLDPVFSPEAVTVDTRHNVYVSDWTNGRITRFSARGARLQTWGTKGTGPGQFLHPGGIALDRHGSLYVADEGNHRIGQILPSGSIRTWNPPGSRRARLSAPVGLVIDARDHLFVSDADTSRITEFALDGTILAQWGSIGSGPGRFRTPQGLALDAAGNLYVADAGNNRIQKFAVD